MLINAAAREIIRRFPREVREQLGRALFLRQQGERLGLPHARPMPNVLAGVSELRIAGTDGAYRAFHYTRSKSGILVCHAFVKKTKTTPDREIGVARSRLKEMLDE